MLKGQQGNENCFHRMVIFFKRRYLKNNIYLVDILTCFYSVCVESALSLLYNPLFLDDLPDHWFDLIGSTDVHIGYS